MNDLEVKWEEALIKIEKKFGDKISLKGVLYLIGVQELSFGLKKFNRDEKINVLHVATCKLLSGYGYYKFNFIDKDGWPHYEELKPLHNLSDEDQQNLIKKAIITYLQ